MQDIYPAGPDMVPAALTKPSSTYRSRAWLAVFSLLLFVVLYVLLAGWFVWTAYQLVDQGITDDTYRFRHFALAGCAGFLALFMLKALFFVKRAKIQDAVEVRSGDQPRLFEFLNRLADGAGAPRPRRVYLSARVNAGVFYDLSLMNLLLPSRKNLEIGLALVNVLTLSEIKAVLAHEFGHFAQRSMAIGSWVYVAQQIAFQIVARRDALDRFLNTISNLDVRIAWLGWLLSLIVWSIRSLIDTMLRLVILAQRALSRQMEFQADLVAVSLTGSDELVHALHKLQAADDAWERTLNFARSELNCGRIPHDLFAVQTRVIEHVARILDDEHYGKAQPAPETIASMHRVFKAGFAQPPQMWSTHPSSADREDNAKRTYLAAPHDQRSAWVLLDQVDETKRVVQAHLLGAAKGDITSPAHTIATLDAQYTQLRYATRYRGVYLGRTLTLHAKRPEYLYGDLGASADVEGALASLYPPQMADVLFRLRELDAEGEMLQALHEKTARATGGRIVYRGREIPRRELPAAIDTVRKEGSRELDRVLAHDRQCRDAHLAAAGLFGSEWVDYLVGLLRVLHYAEHVGTDLRDAQVQLSNTVALATIAGKAGAVGLHQVLSIASSLHGTLTRLHAAKGNLLLDSTLLARMNADSWHDYLEPFTLPPPSEQNINQWLGAIDGWVKSASSSLAGLAVSALEQLLQSEDQIACHFREGTVPETAPRPSSVPEQYPTIIPGQQRARPNQLDWWSRFQVADGFVPAAARLLVAGAIVTAVLGLGNVASSKSTLTIYNGLGLSTEIYLGQHRVDLAPYTTRTIDIALSAGVQVEAVASNGKVIEYFHPPVEMAARHYVYSVAGATPLVLWTVSNGAPMQQSPTLLGAQRWLVSSADDCFPSSLQPANAGTGGATRTVLSGRGDLDPSEVLKVVEDPTERARIIAAHVQWDLPELPLTSRWKALTGP